MAKKLTAAEVAAAILQSSDEKDGASEIEGFDSEDEEEYQNNWDIFHKEFVSPYIPRISFRCDVLLLGVDRRVRKGVRASHLPHIPLNCELLHVGGLDKERERDWTTCSISPTTTSFSACHQIKINPGMRDSPAKTKRRPPGMKKC